MIERLRCWLNPWRRIATEQRSELQALKRERTVLLEICAAAQNFFEQPANRQRRRELRNKLMPRVVPQ